MMNEQNKTKRSNIVCLSHRHTLFSSTERIDDYAENEDEVKIDKLMRGGKTNALQACKTIL